VGVGWGCGVLWGGIGVLGGGGVRGFWGWGGFWGGGGLSSKIRDVSDFSTEIQVPVLPSSSPESFPVVQSFVIFPPIPAFLALLVLAVSGCLCIHFFLSPPRSFGRFCEFSGPFPNPPPRLPLRGHRRAFLPPDRVLSGPQAFLHPPPPLPKPPLLDGPPSYSLLRQLRPPFLAVFIRQTSQDSPPLRDESPRFFLD